MSPRPFPPAPAWSPDGHWVQAPLEYSRGRDKVWIYGALRVRDGQALTQTRPARNAVGYHGLLDAIAAANPDGELYVIGDKLSSHKSPPIQEGLTAHPHVYPVVIPKGGCWHHLQEAWWRLLRREALAGQTFAEHTGIEYATQVATEQLNQRPKPWVWGRPAPPPRQLPRFSPKTPGFDLE